MPALLIRARSLIAFTTLCCFLLSCVAGDGIAALAQPQRPEAAEEALFDGFALPASLGRISAARFYGGERIVVVIQDLHCHSEVQENIARILSFLDEYRRPERICVEGAVGEVRTGWISGIASARFKKELAGTLLAQGRLTGAEYFAAFSGREGILQGLEEPAPYFGNLRRLHELLAGADDAVRRIAAMERRVTELEESLCNARQKRFTALARENRAGAMDNGRWFALLRKYARRLGIGLERYRNIRLLLEMSGEQAHFSGRGVEGELRQFLLSLREQLPYAAYRRLLSGTDNLADTERLSRCLPALVDRYGSAAGPELRRFSAYLRRTAEINPLGVVREEKLLTREILERLAEHDGEREVVFLSGYIGMLRDYVRNRVTAEEYEYVLAHRDAFAVLWRKYDRGGSLGALRAHLALCDEFYRVNEERNGIFCRTAFGDQVGGTADIYLSPYADQATKVTGALRDAHVTVAVTGGFHTEGFCRLLRERRISYMVITPNVTRATDAADATYRLLAGEQGRYLSQTFALYLLSEQLADGAPSAVPELLESLSAGSVAAAEQRLSGVLGYNALAPAEIDRRMQEVCREWNGNLGGQFGAISFLPGNADEDGFHFTFAHRGRLLQFVCSGTSVRFEGGEARAENDDELKALSDDLLSDDVAARNRAAAALQRLGGRAVPLLIGLLKAHQYQALAILSRIDDPAVAGLAGLFNDPSFEPLYREFLAILADHSRNWQPVHLAGAVAPLVRLLRSKEYFRALDILTRAGRPGALALAGAVNDPAYASTRYMILKSLAGMAGDGFLEADEVAAIGRQLLSPGAYQLGELEKGVPDESGARDALRTPVGLELESFDGRPLLKPAISNVPQPNDDLADKPYFEYSTRPSWSAETQLRIARLLNERGLAPGDIISVHVNAGIPKAPHLETRVLADARELMTAVVLAYASDRRIAAKKTGKLVTISDGEPLIDGTKGLAAREYRRLEYAFADAADDAGDSTLEQNLRTIQCAQALITAHHYGGDGELDRLYGKYFERLLSLLQEVYVAPDLPALTVDARSCEVFIPWRKAHPDKVREIRELLEAMVDEMQSRVDLHTGSGLAADAGIVPAEARQQRGDSLRGQFSALFAKAGAAVRRWQRTAEELFSALVSAAKALAGELLALPGAVRWAVTPEGLVFPTWQRDGDRDASRRLQILQQPGGGSGMEIVLAAVVDPDEAVRDRASRDILKYGDAAVGPLLELLQQERYYYVASVLAGFDEKAFPGLLAALKDRRYDKNRGAILFALWRMARRIDRGMLIAAIPALVDAAAEPSSQYALQILELAGASAFEPLAAILDDPRFKENYEQIAYSLQRIVENSGIDPRRVEPLAGRLLLPGADDLRQLDGSPSDEVRYRQAFFQTVGLEVENTDPRQLLGMVITNADEDATFQGRPFYEYTLGPSWSPQTQLAIVGEMLRRGLDPSEIISVHVNVGVPGDICSVSDSEHIREDAQLLMLAAVIAYAADERIEHKKTDKTVTSWTGFALADGTRGLNKRAYNKFEYAFVGAVDNDGKYVLDTMVKTLHCLHSAIAAHHLQRGRDDTFLRQLYDTRLGALFPLVSGLVSSGELQVDPASATTFAPMIDWRRRNPGKVAEIRQLLETAVQEADRYVAGFDERRDAGKKGLLVIGESWARAAFGSASRAFRVFSREVAPVSESIAFPLFGIAVLPRLLAAAGLAPALAQGLGIAWATAGFAAAHVVAEAAYRLFVKKTPALVRDDLRLFGSRFLLSLPLALPFLLTAAVVPDASVPLTTKVLSIIGPAAIASWLHSFINTLRDEGREAPFVRRLFALLPNRIAGGRGLAARLLEYVDGRRYAWIRGNAPAAEKRPFFGLLPEVGQPREKYLAYLRGLKEAGVRNVFAVTVPGGGIAAGRALGEVTVELPLADQPLLTVEAGIVLPAAPGDPVVLTITDASGALKDPVAYGQAVLALVRALYDTSSPVRRALARYPAAARGLPFFTAAHSPVIGWSSPSHAFAHAGALQTVEGSVVRTGGDEILARTSYVGDFRSVAGKDVPGQWAGLLSPQFRSLLENAGEDTVLLAGRLADALTVYGDAATQLPAQWRGTVRVRRDGSFDRAAAREQLAGVIEPALTLSQESISRGKANVVPLMNLADFEKPGDVYDFIDAFAGIGADAVELGGLLRFSKDGVALDPASGLNLETARRLLRYVHGKKMKVFLSCGVTARGEGSSSMESAEWSLRAWIEAGHLGERFEGLTLRFDEEPAVDVVTIGDALVTVRRALAQVQPECLLTVVPPRGTPGKKVQAAVRRAQEKTAANCCIVLVRELPVTTTPSEIAAAAADGKNTRLQVYIPDGQARYEADSEAVLRGLLKALLDSSALFVGFDCAVPFGSKEGKLTPAVRRDTDGIFAALEKMIALRSAVPRTQDDYFRAGYARGAKVAENYPVSFSDGSGTKINALLSSGGSVQDLPEISAVVEGLPELSSWPARQALRRLRTAAELRGFLRALREAEALKAFPQQLGSDEERKIFGWLLVESSLLLERGTLPSLIGETVSLLRERSAAQGLPADEEADRLLRQLHASVDGGSTAAKVHEQAAQAVRVLWGELYGGGAANRGLAVAALLEILDTFGERRLNDTLREPAKLFNGAAVAAINAAA